MNKLLFNKPASQWNEAMPLGNGYLGAMVYGQTNKELVYMNEDSLYSGGPIERENPDAFTHLEEIRDLLKGDQVKQAQDLASKSFYALTPHSRHYQPLGQLWIEFNHDNVNNYQRQLDMSNAIGNIKYQSDQIEYQRECFISYPDNVFVYHIKTKNGEKMSFDCYLTRRDTRSGRSDSYLDSVEVTKDSVYLVGYNGNKQLGIEYVMGCGVQVLNGHVKRYGSRLSVEETNEAVIYVVGRTSFRSENPLQWCKDQLKSVREKNYNRLKETHIKDYLNYYNQVQLDLKSEQNCQTSIPERLENVRNGKIDIDLIETYFHFGRYLLISSSREGSLAANLQGIWNSEFEPPWGSKYTININIQMNYWLAEKIGLSSLHMPLMELQKTMLPRGQKIAKETYGCKGTCAHHNTDIWGDCAPTDYYVPSTLWPMGFLWLSLHIFEHYQYTQDKKFLREYFLIIKENALFVMDYMFKNDGVYATGPSVSPENTYITQDGQEATVCMSPSMDIQIIKEFLQNYLKIIYDLGIDDLKNDVIDHLEHLPPIQIGKHGQIMEWQKDYDEKEIGHRHISQLFALYPGTQIRYDETPELAKAALQTLERRLSHGGGHTGWSCAWIIHFYARLHKPEKAFSMLQKLLSHSTLDNLFDNHPPFQIDGNFGGSNAILEMLVQDYDDKVFLLPALPNEMSEGKLKGLRLKCGALLDIEWEKRKIVNLDITAKRPCCIKVVVNDHIKTIQLSTHEHYCFYENKL